jgi:hypothetical protein
MLLLGVPANSLTYLVRLGANEIQVMVQKGFERPQGSGHLRQMYGPKRLDLGEACPRRGIVYHLEETGDQSRRGRPLLRQLLADVLHHVIIRIGSAQELFGKRQQDFHRATVL